MKTVFLRVTTADDKAEALLRAVHDGALGSHRFALEAKSFSNVPHSPFAYWASEQLLGLFRRFPRMESEGRTAKVGLISQDDFRFVRIWWETGDQNSARTWLPFNKGGSYAQFFRDTSLVLNWKDSGREI